MVLLPSRRGGTGGGGGGGGGPRAPRHRRQPTEHAPASTHTPLPPLVRRLALLILAASYCTILALWSTGGVPDPTLHSLQQQQQQRQPPPQYKALRHREALQPGRGGRNGEGYQGSSGLMESQPQQQHLQQGQRPPLPVSFEGANGLAVPWGGGAVGGRQGLSQAEETEAHQADSAAGEEETERVRAPEGETAEEEGTLGSVSALPAEAAVAAEAAIAVPPPPAAAGVPVMAERRVQEEEEEEGAGVGEKKEEGEGWMWPAEREAAHAEYGERRFGLRPMRWAAGEGAADGCSAEEEDEGQELDFTLVSQTSPDRLWMLAHLCRRWEGPFVLAVFVQEGKFTEAHEAMLAQVPCPNARILRVRPPPRPSDDDEEAAKWDAVWAQPDQFPVNALRNLAIEEVRTSHFLLTDMDLWPARGMYRLLRRLAAPSAATGMETRRAFWDPKQAFVAPAFGFFGPERLGADGLVYPPDPEDVPGDMPALAACAAKGECIVFDSQYNLQGHGTTDTAYWMEAQAPTEVHPIPCFRSNRYEPYLLLNRRCPGTLPPFAEAFTGYGKNKIEHVAHLRFRGFRFSVLPPGAFLVHFPHAPSQSKKSWLGGHQHNGHNGHARPVIHRERMDALYDHFLSWAMQERAARAGDMVRLCPPIPPPPPLPPGEEAEQAGVTSVA